MSSILNPLPKQKKRLDKMTPYVPGFDLTGVSVSASDREDGSPKKGDMIARNPKKHGYKWLVAKDYFKKHYTAV